MICMKRALLVAGLVVFACDAGHAEPATAPPMVDWLAPPVAPSKPQTDAEKAEGMKSGRALPTPELLQPRLDPELPAYASPSGVKLTGHFKAAASDVLAKLVGMWIAAFNKHYPDVVIDLVPPFAGSVGAKELVDGKLDMAFVSRELKPDDITDFKAKFGYDPLSVPVSGGTYRHFGFLDAVGFFVNRDNPIERLNFDQLDAMLSTTDHRGGKPITTWGQLGLTGEWADKPIHLYGVKPWNGFEEFIRQRVLSQDGKRGEWRTDIHFTETVFAIAGEVAADRYGVGYSGLAYIDSPVKMLPVAADAENYQAPSYENVARATYPLARLTYVNLNRAPGKPLDPALAEFIRFICSGEGQQVILDQAIFLPLRAVQAENSRKLVQ